MKSDLPASIFIGSEIRLHVDTQGQTRTYHNAAAYERWRPYQEALGPVSIVARLDRSRRSVSGSLVVGPGVTVIGVRHYHGLREMAMRLPVVALQILRLGGRDSLFIGRLPEPISLLLFLRSRLVRAQFISVVASEPKQLLVALFPGLLGRIVGRFAVDLTRLCIAKSVGVIYVTQRWLQSLYPAPSDVPTIGRSNVALPSAAIASQSRSTIKGVPTLVTVATLENKHKGIDCLLDAIKTLKSRGVHANLVVIGSGRLSQALSDQSVSLGILDQVRFTGHLEQSSEVRRELDAAHVFVLTSRVEGLPRALVEAMARALPVVATRAGGVEELLDEAVLCPIDDVESIADRIQALLTDATHYSDQSRRNLEAAVNVAATAADQRLVAFLAQFKSSARDTLPK